MGPTQGLAMLNLCCCVFFPIDYDKRYSNSLKCALMIRCNLLNGPNCKINGLTIPTLHLTSLLLSMYMLSPVMKSIDHDHDDDDETIHHRLSLQ